MSLHRKGIRRNGSGINVQGPSRVKVYVTHSYTNLVNPLFRSKDSRERPILGKKDDLSTEELYMISRAIPGYVLLFAYVYVT
jgi:hypothetical protein